MIDNGNKKHGLIMYLYNSVAPNVLIHSDNGDQIKYAHSYAHQEQCTTAGCDRIIY